MLALLTAASLAVPALAAPVRRDMTSAWSQYITDGTGKNYTGACGVTYSDASHGACVSSADRCGESVYAYLGTGQDGDARHTTATVVDVCESFGETDIAFTLDSFEELGGTVEGGVIQNVNWKYLPADADESARVSTEGVVVAASISFDRSAAAPAEKKRDMTSAWSQYITDGTGKDYTGACGVTYSDNSHGACVSSSDRCGESVYAYIGNGQDGNPRHTQATVVDVCASFGSSDIAFTLDSFKELGGTVAGGVIRNVNWKYLPAAASDEMRASSEGLVVAAEVAFDRSE